MMANNVIHVGTPPPEHEPWEVFTFHIHNFEQIDATKNKRLELPPFSCFGHEWMLVLYPGGNVIANDGKISVFLHNESDRDAGLEISVNFAVTIRDLFGGAVDQSSSSLRGSFRTDTEFTDSWGVDDYFEREAILKPTSNVLHNGTLNLDLSMQQLASKWKYPIHTPRNPFSKNMLQLYLDDDTADVVFEVRGQLFPAHRAILKLCAPTLSSLCQSCSHDKEPVPIPDIEPIIFRQLLFYVYGGKISISDFENHARDFMEAADKYDVVNLKIEAEIEYVTQINSTVDSVVETLLYADAKNLALLKETAMEFIFKNAKEVLASEAFKSIPPETSTLSELLSLVAMKNNDENSNSTRLRREDDDDMEYKSMSVNDLRWELSKREMDIDGSREMLVSRLEKKSVEEETNNNGRKRKTME